MVPQKSFCYVLFNIYSVKYGFYVAFDDVYCFNQIQKMKFGLKLVIVIFILEKKIGWTKDTQTLKAVPFSNIYESTNEA